jgi:hypothetical protein
MAEDTSVATLRMKAVFDAIGMAAFMLREHEPATIVLAWKRQAERAYFTDPTLMLKVHAQKADMDRKLKLLEAAADFVATVDKIRDEAITPEAIEETQRGMEAARNYGSQQG